jgi:hypothetical protein
MNPHDAFRLAIHIALAQLDEYGRVAKIAFLRNELEMRRFANWRWN